MGSKVGMITYHDGINYGAYWQTYALHNVLQSLTKNNTHIINYKNTKHLITELLVFYHPIYSPKKIIENSKKISKFKEEQKKLRKTKFTTFKRKLSSMNFDTIVYGSDEIWNFKNPLFGLDLTYFGNSFLNTKKIAYAVSFGSVNTKDTIPKSVINGINNFSHIAVRDDNSQKIVEENLGISVPIVCDPTFLIDLKINSKNFKKNYILIYCTKINDEEKRQILDLKRKTKKKLICIGYPHSWCDESFVSIGPTEWLSWFEHADFIITTMFHGTIFSIKNSKNFTTISSEYRKNKIESLLNQFGLKNRIYSDNMLELFNEKINYKVIEKTIKHIKLKSVKYLERSLKS